MWKKWCLGIVFLSLSSAWLEAGVLTVDCDGNADFDEIGLALEAAEEGDTIVVRECGTMPFSYPPIVIDSKFDLHLVAGDQTVGGGVGSTEIGVGAGVQNFRAIATITGPGICVEITGSTQIVLEGFELDQCGDHAIVVDSSMQVSLIGNKIVGSGGDGVRDLGSENTRVEGNIIGQGADSGVALVGSSNAEVVDNLIGLNGDAQGGVGVTIESPLPIAQVVGGTALGNSIINNTLVENVGGCIFDAGGETRIESNTCSGATDTPRTITVDQNAFNGEIVANIGIIDDPFMNSEETDNCPVTAPC